MRVTSSRSSISRASSSTFRRITSSAWRTSGESGRARLQFAHHRDDGRERIAQFVREQSEKLILGGVRADQFLAQGHVARFVFHQIKHALDGLLRTLQAQQIHIYEARHAAEILERLFDQLKRRAEREHFFDRFRAARFSPHRKSLR